MNNATGNLCTVYCLWHGGKKRGKTVVLPEYNLMSPTSTSSDVADTRACPLLYNMKREGLLPSNEHAG